MITNYFTKSKIKSLDYFKLHNLFKYHLVTKQIIENKIKDKIKEINELEVQDTDAGCGQFFMVKIKTPEFKGKSLVEQHRLMNEILKEEVKQIHSLVLKTSS